MNSDRVRIAVGLLSDADNRSWDERRDDSHNERYETLGFYLKLKHFSAQCRSLGIISGGISFDLFSFRYIVLDGVREPHANALCNLIVTL